MDRRVGISIVSILTLLLFLGVGCEKEKGITIYPQYRITYNDYRQKYRAEYRMSKSPWGEVWIEDKKINGFMKVAEAHELKTVKGIIERLKIQDKNRKEKLREQAKSETWRVIE